MSWFIDLAGQFFGGGGLTSAVTGAVGAFTKYKELKLSYDHEKDRWEYEVKMLSAQTAHERYLVENKRLMVTETVSAATLQEAIRGDSAEVKALIDRAGQAPKWAVFRTLFRPIITIKLFIALVAMPFMPMPVVAEGTVIAGPVANLYATLRQGFSAALGFWFGSRAVGERPAR